MEKNILLVCILLLAGGIFFRILASKHKSNEHSKYSILSGLNPKNWIPFWKAQKFYDKEGFIYQSISAVMLSLGAMLYLILLTFIEK